MAATNSSLPYIVRRRVWVAVSVSVIRQKFDKRIDTKMAVDGDHGDQYNGWMDLFTLYFSVDRVGVTFASGFASATARPK